MTDQQTAWAGDMGNRYTDRNPQSVEEFDRLYLKDYDITRTSLNEEFLKDISHDFSILEVGANVGTQLEFLRRMGFVNVQGIEVNEYAVQKSKELYPDVTVRHGSGFALPFEDASFDMVFTSGVLIHISPQDIQKILSEMHRVTRRYLWGFEYYAPTYTEVTYRGSQNLLWKTDFCQLIAETYSDMKVVKDKKYPMTDGKNVSQMYLLEKHS